MPKPHHSRPCPTLYYTTGHTHTHTYFLLSALPVPKIPHANNPISSPKTQTKFKGNPLALVLIPAGVEPATETLQTIAREFNLSETAFLYLNADDDDANSKLATPEWRARIFMIDAELPFAGHPTIGTLCYALGSLAQGASTGRLHIPAGTVDASFAQGVARAAIPHNVHLHVESPFSAAEIEALQPRLAGKGAVRGIDTVSPVRGMNFVCVELDGLEALAVVECTGKRIGGKLDREWDVGFVAALFYVKMGEEEGGRRVRLRTRMIEGVMEDPATGSASCALSAFLSLKGRERVVAYELTQGVEMGRQSEIGIEVRLNEALDGVERLEMSGSCVKVMEGMVEYE
jgi:PhzF family phenazine biosynthesis protein